MNAGHFEQIGAPQEMYESPATGFVARFLGASNLLDGEVAADGRVRLAAGSTIEVPLDRLSGVSGAVKVGVRPEKLHISDRGRSGNSVDATITASTYTGVSTSYSCVTSDGAGILVYVQNLDVSSEVLQDGTSVKLTWDPQHTFVIDDSGSMGEDTG